MCVHTCLRTGFGGSALREEMEGDLRHAATEVDSDGSHSGGRECGLRRGFSRFLFVE